MAFVYRLLLSSTSFRLNKGSVFAVNFSQNWLPVLAQVELCSFSVRKYSAEFIPESGQLKSTSNFRPPRHSLNKKYPNATSTSKLNSIDLSAIVDRSSSLPQGYLIAAFHKLCFKYFENKNNPAFFKELRYFIQSKGFLKFCQTVEKELPRYTPPNLALLLNLVHFKVSPKSTLIRKLLTLILDNLHAFSVVDVLEIYCELKKTPYEDSEEAVEILKACDVYFETVFKDELSYYQNLHDLVHFIKEKNLPLEIKKLITKKFLDEMTLKSYSLSIYPKFFECAFEEPIVTHYKSELLEHLNQILTDHETPKVQNVFLSIYKNALHKYDFIYDEKIFKTILTNSGNSWYNLGSLARISEKFSEVGYFSRELGDKLVDIILSTNMTQLSPRCLVTLASAFTRISYQEMDNPHWNTVKDQLKLVKDYFKINSLFFTWCEYTTYLGCDTKDLLRAVFDKANNAMRWDLKEDYRAVLRLHHLSKIYYPDSDIGLTNKMLNEYLQNSSYRRSFYYNSCAGKIFGSEDYILFNCWTPNCHHLPIVAVLDPNNEPINLSAYKANDPDLDFHRHFRVVTNVENIEKPPGSKVIVFVEYPDFQPLKFRNEPVTSGHWKMFLKPYEGSGCHIIPLNPTFFKINYEQKGTYLKSEIDKIIGKSETTV